MPAAESLRTIERALLDEHSMLDATVLLLGFTDQYRWGFSGENDIFLNCSTDVEDAWYGSLSRVFSAVIRYDIYKGANRGGICAANRDIIDIAQAYLPRYVFYPCNFSGIVTEGTLAALRAMGCVVVADFFDDEVYFARLSRWMAACVDYVVTHVPSLVKEYEKLGARCVLASTVPIDPAVFQRLPDQRKLYDATFVGTLHPYRRDRLTEIAAHGTAVVYMGGGNANKLPYSRMVRIFNQSRVNVNLSSSDARRAVGKILEVPLCGGFLLTEQVSGLERWFDVGREIESFHTAREAADKIRYYLDHPDERQQIAARGYERARGNYAGPVVLGRVIREIEEDLRERGRPAVIALPGTPTTLREADADEYFKWVRALLKQPKPLQDEWYETAQLVIATNPAHAGAKHLLDRARTSSCPELVENRWRGGASLLFSALRSLRRRTQARLSDISVQVRTPLQQLRRARFALEVQAFRKRYSTEPAPLELCVGLRIRASTISCDEDPLLPPSSRLLTSGDCLRDAQLATILQGVELGRWAIASDTVDWLSDFLQRERPKVVLEFGSGVSTVCMCALLQRLHGPGGYKLLSLEQNPAEAERTSKILNALAGGGSCHVVHVPLIPAVVAGAPTFFYDLNGTCSERFAWLGKADFVFIDGPAAEGPSRYGTLTQVPSNIVAGAKFAMDDGLREEELLTGSLWAQQGIVVDGVLTRGKGLMIGNLPVSA